MIKKLSYILVLFISLFIVGGIVKADTTCPATGGIEYTFEFDSNGKMTKVTDKNNKEIEFESSFSVKNSDQCPKSTAEVSITPLLEQGVEIGKIFAPSDAYNTRTANIICYPINDMKYTLEFVGDSSSFEYLNIKSIKDESGNYLTINGYDTNAKLRKYDAKKYCPIHANELNVTKNPSGGYTITFSYMYYNRIDNYGNEKGCSQFETQHDCKTNSNYSCVWVDKDTGKVSDKEENGYCNVDNLQYVQCGEAFDIPAYIPRIVSFFINLLKIATPIILVFTSVITLLKSLTANKEDEMAKARGVLVRRLVIAALIFFTITITQFVINKVADEGEPEKIGSCFNCFINNNCEVTKYYKNYMDDGYQCYYVNDKDKPFDGKCH